MPKPRVNPYAIRRIVGAMPANSTEDQVRARARECCVAGSSAEFIQAAEAAAVRYFQPGNLRWATKSEQVQNRRPSSDWRKSA